MGLYKRKDSQFHWMSYTVAGKRILESTETTNKKLAETIYAKRLMEVMEGKWFERKVPEDVAMGELIERYMQEVSPNCTPSTQERNKYIARNLVQFFGSYRLSQVSPSVVSQYKAKRLQAGYDKQTILRELGVLRRIFNLAIQEWELCERNPVPKALRSLGKIDSGRVRYLNPEEAQKLAVALPSWMRPIVQIARQTGLRRGNLLELTWQQVDFKRRQLTIPKTKNGTAIGIPLTDTAIRILEELQRVRHLHSPWVFCDQEGRCFPPKRASVAFGRACKRAGIKNLRFHDLRHDFASCLVQEGIDINTVKELLGHKDLRMTTRCRHLSPEKLRKAIRVLDREESGDTGRGERVGDRRN